VTAAAANKPEAEVLETVLVRLVNDSQEPPLNKLAWAVNFDPATVEAIPPSGPAGAPRPRFCDLLPEYDVVFIDAQTGELIFELTYTAALPDSDPAATCPPGNYPSPTAVPGQPTAVPDMDESRDPCEGQTDEECNQTIDRLRREGAQRFTAWVNDFIATGQDPRSLPRSPNIGLLAPPLSNLG
jgi:hypothetical protein